MRDGNSLKLSRPIRAVYTCTVLAAQFTGRSYLLERLEFLGFESLREHPDVYGDGLARGDGEVTFFEMVQASALGRCCRGTTRPRASGLQSGGELAHRRYAV